MTSTFKGWSEPPPIDPVAAKAASYSRFIPREELGGFAAWKPSELSDLGVEPRVDPAPVVDRRASDPVEQYALKLHQARQSGYQDGYRDGLIALEGFKQSFAHQATLQVGTLLQSIGAQLDALQQEMAQTLSATALGLARQVVRSELRLRPELVAEVAREAVDTLLLSARHITLRVHPDDEALVADGAAEVLAARGTRLVADPAVARGGCLVESNIGVIDATLEARWRRAGAGLGAEEPWQAADAPPAAAAPDAA